MPSPFARPCLLLLALAASAFAQATSVPLAPGSLTLKNLQAATVDYQGRSALRLTPASTEAENLDMLATINGVEFKDGTIELEVAGMPGPGAAAAARGFVGVAFRVAQGAGRYEYLYLRPTNGRADDQVRRNHSTQYSSHPDHPWSRLRKESPEKYESYVDLEPGAWTRMRVVVSGTTARLYVHGAPQPVLVVNDLKLGDGSGGVGLWVGPGTVAHFANLRVTR